jgi:acetyl esterase
MSMIRVFGVVCVGILSCAVVKAKDEVESGKVFVYKQSAGKDRKMEVYFPEGHDPQVAKMPGLILFHGGGWSGGSLGQFRRACSYFASRGLVCATVEYQMLSKQEGAALPEGVTRKRVCITDAKSAIRWFKGRAAEFGMDPQRIITGGGSAGGHISALAISHPGLNDPADDLTVDLSVVAYLGFNPAFDVQDSQDVEVDGARYLGAEFPPAVVFFGTKDNWKVGWDAMVKQMREKGNQTTEVWVAEGQPHGFFNKDPWQTATLAKADAFLIKLGLLEGEARLGVSVDAVLNAEP